MVRKAKSLRILLVDDHELVRRGIRGLLSAKRSWKVVGEAVDGNEAIEKARKLKPDVVILDIDMPNLNGLDAAPRVREAAPQAKIVFLTLHESGEMIRRAVEIGAQGYVLKSDLAAGLVTALKEISHSKIFFTPKVSAIVVRGFLKRESPEKSGKNGKDLQVKPTRREAEIIRLLGEGRANKEIAAALGITVRTAEAHRANIMRKLGVHSLAELIHYALRNGMASIRSSE